MSRAAIESKMARESGITHKQAETALNTFIGYIVESLKGGQKVPLKGFGTFAVSEAKARTGRNPRTGEIVQIAAKKRVRFSPSKNLKDEVNR